jgi:hypothetical protein
MENMGQAFRAGCSQTGHNEINRRFSHSSKRPLKGFMVDENETSKSSFKIIGFYDIHISFWFLIRLSLLHSEVNSHFGM